MSEHINYLDKSVERLNEELAGQIEIDQPWQCDERRAQIKSKIAYLSFELSMRYAESKGIDTELAWMEYADVS